MDEQASKYDVAMDLITLLYLGGERRVFSDRSSSLAKAILLSLDSMPEDVREFFGNDGGAVRTRLGEVLGAATELEMLTWHGDDLEDFEIHTTGQQALMHSVAINVPFETMCDMGRILCHAVNAESI